MKISVSEASGRGRKVQFYAALCALGMMAFLAGRAAPPGLTIAPSGTNLVIHITNGVSTSSYAIYRTPLLADPAYPWTLHVIGATGQTSFTVAQWPEIYGFFQVLEGTDWDLDGVPNQQDAQPANNTVGALAITIDFPANGQVFQ